MKKILLIVFLMNVTVATMFAQKNAVDKFILNEMKEVGIQGMSVAVVKSGKILKLDSYGLSNIEWNIPVSNSTLFPMASVTKLFTSSLVVDMVNRKEIDINAPITEYIKNAPYIWEEIKVKHLLSHKSGIKWLKEIDHSSSTEQAVNALKDSTLMFKPGSKEYYASSDYTVLKYIIENITASSYEVLIKERIFSKYNMTNCGFDMEKRKGSEQTMKPLKNKTQVYLGNRRDVKIYKYYYPQYSYCAGGLWMNITDASSWIVALDKGEINKDKAESMLYEKININNNNTSKFSNFGWTVFNYQNHECVGHSGGPAVAEILRIPAKKITVIVFTNQRNILPYLAKSIASFYIKDLKRPTGRKTLEF